MTSKFEVRPLHVVWKTISKSKLTGDQNSRPTTSRTQSQKSDIMSFSSIMAHLLSL